MLSNHSAFSSPWESNRITKLHLEKGKEKEPEKDRTSKENQTLNIEHSHNDGQWIRKTKSGPGFFQPQLQSTDDNDEVMTYDNQ